MRFWLPDKFLGKLYTNRPLALLVFAGAVAVQVYLAKMPLQIDLETIPVTARLGQEELVIGGLTTEEPTGVLLTHNGRQNEVVDVYFERAQLAGETFQLLTSVGLTPPSALGQISYVTQDTDTKPGSGEPCRTSILFQMKTAPKPVTTIHFYQQDKLPADRYRTLELRAIGGELMVRMNTVAPPNGNPHAPGCQKLLRANEWRQVLGPSVGIIVAVPPDSSLRFRFQSLAGNAMSLESGLLDIHPLQARSLEVKPLPSRKPMGGSSLYLSSAGAKEVLRVTSLDIGADQLQVKVLGKGWVKKRGEYLTYDFLERLKNFPIIAGLLGALDGALINWLKILFFGSGSGAKLPSKHRAPKPRWYRRRNPGSSDFSAQ